MMTTSEDAAPKAAAGEAAPVVDAIYAAIDDVKKEALIKSALASLVVPKELPYGQRGKSDLERAFELEVHARSHDLVKETLARGEIHDRANKVVAAVFDKLLSDRDALAREMAFAMTSAISTVLERLLYQAVRQQLDDSKWLGL